MARQFAIILPGAINPRVRWLALGIAAVLVPAACSQGGTGAIASLPINEISKTHPDLWQGADILRIDNMLPHYRLIALAAARAGIVVSNDVSAIQEETPRKALSAGVCSGSP